MPACHLGRQGISEETGCRIARPILALDLTQPTCQCQVTHEPVSKVNFSAQKSGHNDNQDHVVFQPSLLKIQREIKYQVRFEIQIVYPWSRHLYCVVK